jgi:hypothetical protein
MLHVSTSRLKYLEFLSGVLERVSTSRLKCLKFLLGVLETIFESFASRVVDFVETKTT